MYAGRAQQRTLVYFTQFKSRFDAQVPFSVRGLCYQMHCMLFGVLYLTSSQWTDLTVIYVGPCLLLSTEVSRTALTTALLAEQSK